MNTNRVKLIFTDLDGTLLDHDTYEWQAANEAIELANELQIPIIPTTSKTLSECIALQAQLKLNGPVIYENGAGVALPKNQFDRPSNRLRMELSNHWVCGFSADYETIRKKVLDIKKYGHYVFKGFGDMTPKEIGEATDLPEERAALSKKRLHTEPILWLDDAKSFNHFHKDIREAGLSLTRGGRFVHVLEACDKGRTMEWLTKRYDPTGKKGTWTIALGDSPNDIPMLQAADVAVIVKNPHRGALEYSVEGKQRLIRTEQPGPVGWNAAVLKLLTEEPVHG